MSVTVPYGDKVMDITIPEDRLLGVLKAGSPEPGDEAGLLREAVASPLGSGALSSFAAAGDRVLVLVNDATRPTPTARMLEAFKGEMAGWDLSFLVATGSHRAPTEEECRGIFGGLWDQSREKVVIHDARDASRLCRVGRTSAGTEVILNRLAVEASKILVLSSVEAHYFAGYTGGRKIMLPGIAALKTIEQNHRLAMSPLAQALSLEGNPVHRDMDEALGFMSGTAIFAVLAVMDREQKICSVAAGDIRAAFDAAAVNVNELFAVPVPEKADIVAAVASPPLDIDFYQAQKVVENGKLVLKQGGILIVISPCRAGVGNDAFLEVMRGAGSPRDVLEKVQNGYRLGYHKAARLAEVATWADIWAVTGVDDAIVETAFMKPFPDVQSALDAAFEARPAGKAWVLLDAASTVPYVAAVPREDAAG